MTDTYITLTDLRVYARHGVSEQERRVGNWFRFDIVLHYDAAAAMRTDDLGQALSYAEVTGIVRREADIPSRLLERLAGRVHRALCDRFPQITAGSIAVTKMRPPVTGLGEASFTLKW